MNDITLQLTYTLGSRQTVCTQQLTAQQPTSIVVESPPVITSEQFFNPYTGDCEGLVWGTLNSSDWGYLQVQDQFGKAMPGLLVTESATIDASQTSPELITDGVNYDTKIGVGFTATAPDGSFPDKYLVEIDDAQLCDNPNVQAVWHQVVDVAGCLGNNTVVLSPGSVKTSYPITLQ